MNFIQVTINCCVLPKGVDFKARHACALPIMLQRCLVSFAGIAESLPPSLLLTHRRAWIIGLGSGEEQLPHQEVLEVIYSQAGLFCLGLVENHRPPHSPHARSKCRVGKCLRIKTAQPARFGVCIHAYEFHTLANHKTIE